MAIESRGGCRRAEIGRTAYQAEGYEAGQDRLRVVGDADKKTVDIMTSNNRVTLTFTDKPWPSTPAAVLPRRNRHRASQARSAQWVS